MQFNNSGKPVFHREVQYYEKKYRKSRDKIRKLLADAVSQREKVSSL